MSRRNYHSNDWLWIFAGVVLGLWGAFLVGLWGTGW